MQAIKRIGVYLDEWPDDKDVLAYVVRVAELFAPDSVDVVYLARREDDHPDGPLDHEGILREHLTDELMERVHLRVERRNAVDTMLKTARERELDLILAGRTLPSSQLAVGHAFNRLARKAPCHVLLIPEGASVHLARILVPVDFSPHAKLTLQTAVALARACGEARPQIHILHAFQVGYGYTKTGRSLEDVVRDMQELYRDRLTDFIKDVDFGGVPVELYSVAADHPEAAIVDCAQTRKVDLLCIGSRGKTAAAAALLGGIADRIVAQASVPVLIVKQKGETLNLLDALFGRD
jgi:nucleotide-binding universal stress UspA family protein